MTDLTFRPATPDDIPTIIALMAAGAVGDTPDSAGQVDHPGYRKAFDAISNDPNHMLVVAERNGQVVGTMQLSFLPGIARQGMWRGLLENVHIRTDLRGHGLGTTMIQWAIAQCRERGCGLVQLTSNKARLDAHRFYERLGFSKSHEGFKLFL